MKNTQKNSSFEKLSGSYTCSTFSIISVTCFQCMAFVETSFFKGINFYTNTKLIPFESVIMENLQYFIKIYAEIKREENFVNINIKLN